MIFVATGTQYPFDRLLNEIDVLLKSGAITTEVIAQTGGSSSFSSPRFECHKKMDGLKFEEYVRRSELIISHAGMGTILTAIAENKNIIIVPRLKKFKEHINDHQLDTLEKINHPLIIKCENISDLADSIIHVNTSEKLTKKGCFNPISDYIREILPTQN